ncbi:transcription initiation factor TFIID subunit 1 [Aristolochia californica]|uniref:transcription initiation factor TFIID subunit 1 n=1 Tax=Aristolochia californica TaxID=171875 RepID=UPI0035DC96F7
MAPSEAIEDDEDYEEAGGGNRFLGFMFGNVDDSGDLDVDYLDEDAKEHIAALADKLAPSLKDIDLTVKASTPTDASEQDYDEKAEDAVDYEDIEEQYEGPEIEVTTEEDHLLSKKDYLSTEVPFSSLDHKASVFDEENYDEEEGSPKEAEVVESHAEAETIIPASGGPVDLSYENDKRSDDILASLGSMEPEDVVVDFEDVQEYGTVSPQAFEDRGGSSLPVLCMEDGIAILRFSEIFGVHEPLSKAERRNHRTYSFLKERYKAIDLCDNVEEDEQAFLKSSCQGHLTVKHFSLTAEDDLRVRDTDLEQGEFGISPAQVDRQEKESYLSSQPMKDGIVVDLSIGWQAPLSPRFYPLDQENWEERIIWGNASPASHKSLESCGALELPDTDHFPATDMDLDVVSHKGVDFHKGLDAQDHTVSLYSCPVSVESWRTTDSFQSLEETYHPQMLRLETFSEIGDADFLEEKKDKGAQELCKADIIRHLSKLSLRNKDLLDGSWLESIIWDSAESISKPKLILDLQDERMLFEILDNKAGRQLRSHAAAMIITRSLKPGSGDSFDLPAQGGPPLGRFNISNDKYYSNRKTSQQTKSHAKKRAVLGIKILHSVPALKLQTMKPKLSNKDIANFHRPKALWYPHDNEVVAKEQGKLSMQGPIKIILKSLGGKGCKLNVDAGETLASVKAKASKKLDFKSSEKVKVFYSGRELEDVKSLGMQNVRPNSVLHLVRTKVHLWSRAQKLPGENKPLRPPGAFKKKSELSAKVGHVFLMEYCEERPLLLSNVGMGARLCTYYQKSGPGDQNASLLRNGTDSVGNVLTLEPTDKSPFLGDVRPGCFQSSIETNLFRAPIFSHKLSSTDYLLVRSPKGKLSLRRIDKLHVVGQQEPHMEVISPGSKGVQAYIGNRLLVYLYREFRANLKPGFLPCVRADELSAQFPNLSEAFLRKRLKHCADLQRGVNGQLFWVMRRNFRIPLEEELRRIVTPENVCAYESMQAGLYRLKRLGISRLTHPVGLTSAMNQLPDEAIALAAAAHIERELQITSWNLSCNFVACTNQDRENIERLEITGVGDPSGRGLGFSYVRVAPKAPIASATVKKKVAAPRGGTTVTGTDADLRRLNMEAAREVLLNFNIPEDQIEKMTRWHRIAMVRKLSSEQAASGVKVDAGPVATKFARGQRMSYLQLQQQTREKCQEIWDRQVQSLSATDVDENESDSEANSDLDSFAGDLENLLDAEEFEDAGDGSVEFKRDKADGVHGVKMRRAPQLVQAEEEIEDEAAEAAELCRMLMDDDEVGWKNKKASKSVGKELVVGFQFGFTSGNVEPTKKSKVRGVTCVSQPDGSFSQEIIVPDPKEVESFLSKRNLSEKIKSNKTSGMNEVLHSGIVKKKIKAIADGFKVMKEKKHADKPTREGFTCGACGQPGHMRTNKNCPKYGEEPEIQVKTTELENMSAKTNVQDLPTPHQAEPPPLKKLIPKGTTKMALVETPESSEKLSSKIVLPLKLKCGSSEKPQQKGVPSTETVPKSVSKINKIVFSNKLKPEEVLLEPEKQNLPGRAPAVEVEREQPRKKLIIKQTKGVNNVEQVRNVVGFGVDDEYKKTKRMVELAGVQSRGKQDLRILEEEILAERRANEERRFWEEEEKRRSNKAMKEAKARRIFEEEKRMQEERQRQIELRRYEEAMTREREEREEREKAKKKKKKKKMKKKKPDVRDDYLEDARASRYDRRIPERERAAKKRPAVDLGRHAAEHGPQTKRRRGGEVALSNVLENIVDGLKDAKEVSFLFLKPVSKKEAPNYLDIIDSPMDLSTIKEKVRRMDYKNREDFRHDVWQITFNAHKYNDGINPGIPPLADQLLELCDYLLQENEDRLDEAESGIEIRD